VSDLKPGDDVGLVDLFAACLDHAYGFTGAGHDQVHGALVYLLVRGLTTQEPSTLATRTAPTGPRKGASERLKAAEAPASARTS